MMDMASHKHRISQKLTSFDYVTYGCSQKSSLGCFRAVGLLIGCETSPNMEKGEREKSEAGHWAEQKPT